MTTINADTQVCGSIARHASSLGAAMYNAAYRELGLNFIYLPFGTIDTEGAIRAMRALNFRGLAAADPHNTRLAPFIDVVDSTAERIGSVNTILNDNGVLKGYNSDWIGFRTAFEEAKPLAGRKVIVLGAGGAARAVTFALLAGKADEVMILNRTQEKGKKLADHYGLDSGPLELLRDLRGFDTLVNATSVGAFSNETKELVGKEELQLFENIVDVVFAPVETPLIAYAKRMGKTTVVGWRMLLHQGAFQFKLFTEVDPPVELLGQMLYKGLVR